MVKVDAALGSALNGAMTGDVTRFRDRGGKLILFQGWADPIVPIGQTVSFYKALIEKFGGEAKTEEFARLFMVPGMGHCGFGTGPNRFDSSAFGGLQPPSLDPEHDMFSALSHWVEDGVAPAAGHRDEVRRRRCVQGNRDAAAALPLSTERLVQGRGRHQRRGEFHLRRRQEVIGLPRANDARTAHRPDLTAVAPRPGRDADSGDPSAAGVRERAAATQTHVPPSRPCSSEPDHADALLAELSMVLSDFDWIRPLNNLTTKRRKSGHAQNHHDRRDDAAVRSRRRRTRRTASRSAISIRCRAAAPASAKSASRHFSISRMS